MFQTKVVEKIKTRILRSMSFFENRVVYEIIWETVVEWGRPHDNMAHGIACWIPKATNTQVV